MEEIERINKELSQVADEVQDMHNRLSTLEEDEKSCRTMWSPPEDP